MTWLLPTQIPTGGVIRSVVKLDQRDVRAYNRAYYHARRKAKIDRKPRTPEQRARERELFKARYNANPEKYRAIARENYWRHRDEYAAKARAYQAKKRGAA